MGLGEGKRVPFGKPGAPVAPLSDAVMASCAIPAWFQPVEINGHKYVDGGACSATSVDLVADMGLDEVYVLAPRRKRYATTVPRWCCWGRGRKTLKPWAATSWTSHAACPCWK